jgi:hypothetical protein
MRKLAWPGVLQAMVTHMERAPAKSAFGCGRGPMGGETMDERKW